MCPKVASRNLSRSLKAKYSFTSRWTCSASFARVRRRRAILIFASLRLSLQLQTTLSVQ
jgi:hypothetical protein